MHLKLISRVLIAANHKRLKKEKIVMLHGLIFGYFFQIFPNDGSVAKPVLTPLSIMIQDFFFISNSVLIATFLRV